MKKRILFGVAAAFGFMACGGKHVETIGVTSKEDAIRFTKSNQAAMSSMQNEGSSTARATKTVHCVTSGTVDLNFDTSLGALAQLASGSFKVNLVAHDCKKLNAYDIDGSIDYEVGGFTGTSTANGIDLSFTMNGSVAATIYKEDGTIDQQANVTYNNLKWKISSTTTNGCVTWSATTTGTITVGGTTYTPTDADVAGVWGSGQTSAGTVCANQH